MILIEPHEAWLQRQLDKQYTSDLLSAHKAASVPPLPTELIDEPSEWDKGIMALFLNRRDPVQLSSAATALVRGVPTFSRAERRAAWRDCISRLNTYVRLGVLVRFKRNFACVATAYMPRKPIKPARLIVNW